MENCFVRGNIFEEKNVVEKINFYSLLSEEISNPTFPEGEVRLTIVNCKSEKMYGRYVGDIKVEIILEDGNHNRLVQMFILKKGKNNNFARFLSQVLEYDLEEINLKELIGKQIIATVFHFYNEQGVGYANIGYFKSILAQDSNK